MIDNTEGELSLSDEGDAEDIEVYTYSSVDNEDTWTRRVIDKGSALLDALRGVLTEKNIVFFVGTGGSGKSHLIRRYLDCKAVSIKKTDSRSEGFEIFVKTGKAGKKKFLAIDTPGDRDLWIDIVNTLNDSLSTIC